MDYIEYLIDGLEEDGYEYEVQENSDEAVVILVEHSGVVVKILCVGNFINLSTILEDVEISYSDCYGKKSDKRKERLNRLNLENEDYRFTNELDSKLYFELNKVLSATYNIKKNNLSLKIDIRDIICSGIILSTFSGFPHKAPIITYVPASILSGITSWKHLPR